MNSLAISKCLALPLAIAWLQIEVQASDGNPHPPFLDRQRILPATGIDDGIHSKEPVVWYAWNRLLRGILSNGCIIREREDGNDGVQSSGTFRLLWIDFFQETRVPMTNLTVLARFSIDFNEGTVDPIPSPSPLSDSEALSIVTNRFPDAVGVEGVPPLVQRVGGITIVGIPARPDERTDGTFYLYDPIVWIHDETKVIFEYCSQESELPVPGLSRASSGGTP